MIRCRQGSKTKKEVLKLTEVFDFIVHNRIILWDIYNTTDIETYENCINNILTDPYNIDKFKIKRSGNKINEEEEEEDTN